MSSESTSKPEPVSRQTMASMLVEALRERIVSFKIPEGTQLRQDSLAAEFGVSRIPVREALLQLEGEGLVAQVAHRSYTVTSLSLEEIREVFDLRAVIEVDLLHRAMPAMTAEDIEAARSVLAVFDDDAGPQNGGIALGPARLAPPRRALRAGRAPAHHAHPAESAPYRRPLPAPAAATDAGHQRPRPRRAPAPGRAVRARRYHGSGAPAPRAHPGRPRRPGRLPREPPLAGGVRRNSRLTSSPHEGAQAMLVP
ncbi:MAG: GntR family transcriptional regulator [Halofilum sp. (in: g-proteobacteria)]|nr:GntR family transcriptional regulator [Halofilum sp. (in: g-proteobacteria)]